MKIVSNYLKNLSHLFQIAMYNERLYTKEILEILEFLSQTSIEYAIFAGFASHLLVGVETSLDVDILCRKKEDCIEIGKIFELNSWIVSCKSDSEERFNLVLTKNGSDFDLVFTPHSARHFVGKFIRVQTAGSHIVKVLSPEALFLVKISQLTGDRSVDKIIRDVEVLKRLRTKMDTIKIQELVSSLDNDYWIQGRY